MSADSHPDPDKRHRIMSDLSVLLLDRDEMLRNFYDPRYEGRRLFSELIGTFFLVLVACGGAVARSRWPCAWWHRDSW